MKRILAWIKTHKTLVAIISVLVFVLPLVVVHFLFKWHPGIPWLEAEWLAGDVLGYIAGFETLLGTVVLGFITVYQSDRANEANERLSKENNFLQKIGIQKSLPLVRVTSIEVQKAGITTRIYQKEKSSIVEVADTVTAQKRVTHLRTYLPLLGNQINRYHKIVKLTLENISDSAISQISVNSIEFSSFKFKTNVVPQVCCSGCENAKYIGWLLLPGEPLTIIVDIFFDNPLYKNFWEYEDNTSIGNFDMCLQITNTSLSGIECKEKIYVNKAVGFAERVMYKANEEELDNA